MKHIHASFKTKKVLNFVGDLIAEYHYNEYSDLSDTDKYLFAAYLLEAGGASDEFSCLTESANAEQSIIALRNMLCGKKDSELNFIETIKDNVLDYYDYTMKSIFNYVLDDYHAERRAWSYQINSNYENYQGAA